MNNDQKMIQCGICKQFVIQSNVYSHNKVCFKKQQQHQATEQEQMKNQKNKNEEGKINIINSTDVQSSNFQLELINQYLNLIEKNQDILKKGKKLLKNANIFKGEFQHQQQQNCLFCNKKFQINENFIGSKCCLKLFHNNCFYQNLRQSTQCFNCKREVIQQKNE